MNLIVGDSHVHFAFNEVEQSSITECLKIIQCKDWTGLSHKDGVTIYSASRNIEKELILNGIDISRYSNMFWMFGTNDALINRMGGQSPKEYVFNYINSIENIRLKYGIEKSYVICPFYINLLDEISHWDPIRDKMNTHKDMNDIILNIKKNIILESYKYKNIEVLDMHEIFKIGEENFAKIYSLDGVHFNNKGRDLFWNKIKESLVYEY